MAQAALSSDVHCGQRVAPIGIGILQYGQSFIAGAGAGLGWSRLATRTTRKIANATIRNATTLLKNNP